ncbi:lipid A biosynthesis lauroyl acyltransferase [Neisseria sp. Ec49-e6-T10]|uniref:lipid A biosynthesis lauroyl acyltransferase n=1 Tax=Neisseria sp. Ec49-e6-T10 TaxID=3140744 RepID=UPI003EB94ED9
MKFAFFILYLIHFLPLKAIHFMAKGMGSLAFYLAKDRRHVGLTNLKLCFPEWTEEKRIQVLKANFYHMAALFLEYGVCWYSSAKRIDKLVQYQDKHYLDDALANGEHVILLYPHFCAFEMGVYKLNQTQALTSIYAHQKNKTVDEAIFKHRHRYNNVRIVSRQQGFLSIIKTIKNHRQSPFLYLPDQDFGPKESIFVRFFHTQAATITGLNRMTKLTGAKVIPLICVREKNGFKMIFYPPWTNFPTEDVVADTQRMNDFIQELATTYPEQYFWLHKRFKTRPEGEQSVY